VSSFNAATNEVIVDINFSVDIAAGDNVLFYDGDHGSGIAFSGHYITVRGNIIHDIGNSGVLYSYDFTPSGGARVNRAHDILIEKNLIYDPPSYDMAVIDFGGSTTYDVGGNISILYNTIIGQVGKDNAGGPQTSEVPNAKWNYGSAINMELNPVADLSTINITGNLFIGVSEVNGTNIYNNLIYFSNGVFETDAVGPNRNNVIYGGYNNGSYVWDQGYLFEFNSSWFADGSNFNKTFDVGNHGYTFYNEFGIRNESDACSSGIVTHGNFVGQACTNAANITADSVYPQFSSYWDNNASLIDSGTGLFNVTLANTNGTVILTFNNQNYTASNVSGSATRFNVSIASLTSGTYTYNWSSYGNGTSHNYNVSNVKTYTVNSSDTSYPIFSTYWDNNGTLTGSGTGLFNVTLANTNGTVLLEINGVNVTAKNNSGSATRFNVSYSFSSSGTYVYKWYSWGNGTLFNYNVSNLKNYTVNATPDTTFPSIVITYPSNNSNTTNTQINVNYTRSDNIAIGSCWYSNTSGAVNYTLLNCANMTGVTWLQGINNITIWVNDTAGNQNNSKITFTVDTIAPSINIVTPTNNSNSTNVNLDVNYTASDNIALSLCWYSNDTYSVNTTIACGTNITTITWTQGKHNVTVWTNDTLNNKNSSRVSFTVDSVAPYFTTFANQTLTSSQSLSYDINAVDAVIGLGTFKINSTSIFSIVSSTGILTNTSALSAGNYYINVSVNDTLGNTNSSIIWINVSSDVTAPIVSLVSPTSWTSSSTVTFTYNVTDASSISNCSLIITNGTIDQTTTSITRNISQTFTKSLSNANYNWSVNCTDISNNIGNSSTLSLTVSYTETVPTSTGGGGGSGGSSTVISPTTNTTSNATIIPIEGEFILGSITKIIPFITLSQAGSLTNNNITFAINEMNIQVNEETNNVELTIIRYGAKPLNVTKPTNSKIYQYLEINSKNLNSLENITINFRADKDWASLNEIEKENVALFHFNEDASKWEEVPTVYSSENENYYYYNATISSLSYFYIGESSTTIKVVTTFLNLLNTIFIFVKTNILWIIIGIILMIIMFLLIKLIPYAVKKAKEKKKESKIKERIDLIKQQSISPIAKPIIEHKEILQEKPIVKPKQIIQPKIPVKSEPKLIERKEIIKPREEIPKRIISSTERINIEKDRLRNEIANLRKEITSHEKLADKKSKK
jgi:PGF-pre-PGF domain-containing protein